MTDLGMTTVIIQTVAKSLQRECRETDFVARIGGEEFGVILPHLNRRS